MPMNVSNRKLNLRAALGFALGIFVCIIYWMTRGVSREVWFDPHRTNEFINSKMWFWPTAVLDVAIRETRPNIAAVILYAINGITYMIISAGLFVVRGRPRLYVALSAAILVAITWFNASVMQTFSWIWFVAVAGALGILAFSDLKWSRS